MTCRWPSCGGDDCLPECNARREDLTAEEFADEKDWQYAVQHGRAEVADILTDLISELTALHHPNLEHLDECQCNFRVPFRTYEQCAEAQAALRARQRLAQIMGR